MATPNFAQAWKGTVSIGGTLFNALQFDYEEFGDLEDITYSVSGGVTGRVVLPGYPGVRGTVTAVYDAANQPVLSPFQMYFGVLMVIIMYPEGTKPYSFSAYAGNFKWSSGPQAGVTSKFTTSFESTGAITRPLS